MRNRVLTIGLGAAAMTAFFGLAGARVALADAESDMFKKMDTDGDGKISADEFAAAHKEKFQKMDTNGDGKLSPEEMKAGFEKGAKMMGKSAGPYKEEAVAEKIKMMDTNNDGYISEDEFMAGQKTMFDKMDTDHDGYLTKSELKAGHEKMKSKIQEKTQEKAKSAPSM
jgi:Ca2+-binding EF-hand superfamily protein